MKKKISKHVGSQIKHFRLRSKLTQKELGEKLGVKHNTVSSYEKGVNEPEQDMLFRMAEVFDVSINEFFPYEEIKKDGKYNYFPSAISAGAPFSIDGQTEAKKISVSDEVLGRYANDKDVFFANINGDSMNNIMDDGTLIAVKPVEIETLKDGDIVVYSSDGEYSIKHFYITADNIIFKPNSTNNSHHEKHFSINDGVKIHGKVVTYIVNMN